MSLFLTVSNGHGGHVSKNARRKMTRISEEAEAGLGRIEKATSLDVSALLRGYIDGGNRFFDDHGFITLPCAMVPVDRYKQFLEWERAQEKTAKDSIEGAKAKYEKLRGTKSRPV